MVPPLLNLNSLGLFQAPQSKIRPLTSVIFAVLLILPLLKLRFYAEQNYKLVLTFLPQLFTIFLFPIKTTKNLIYPDRFIINFNLQMTSPVLLLEYNFADKLAFIHSYFLTMKGILLITLFNLLILKINSLLFNNPPNFLPLQTNFIKGKTTVWAKSSSVNTKRK